MPKPTCRIRRRQCAARTLPAPVFEQGGITLFRGDCLDVLRGLERASVDAVITDPPYSSGGITTAERMRDPAEKYCQNGNACGRPSFAGDMRDQRSFRFWATLWASECRRLVKPGGYCLIFTDWRQLPTMSDVLQAGGFVWRGIIAWDKGRGSRAPHKGYFRHQCEYVVWGTNGRCESTESGPWDGCIQQAVLQRDKHHITGKPTDLMKQLVQCVPPGGTVLDCFGGSGTTAVACAQTGRRCIAIEQSPEYTEISRHRVAAVSAP